MNKLLVVLLIAIGVSAVLAHAQMKSAQPPRTAPVLAAPAPPITLSLAPLEMTGMRGATAMNLQLQPLEMTGMRGAAQPVALNLQTLEMTGMRGATAPLNLQLNPLVMTGMRGAPTAAPAVRH